MAEERRRRTPGSYIYSTSGSAALQPELVPEERPQQPQRRKQQRKPEPRREQSYRLREQEAVSLFGLIGFAAVAVLACLCIFCEVQLNTINRQLVSCTAQISELQEEEEKLEAQYESLFDLQSIESDMLAGGRMIKPVDSQRVYLELSEEDNAETFDGTGGESFLSGLKSLFE